MVRIKNMEELIENGETQLDKRARALALKSLENAINAVDPKHLIKLKVHIKNAILYVGGYSFDLKSFKNIYVLGGGKASGLMAEALEEVLSDRIKDGIVNVPHGSDTRTKNVKIHGASHPIPDKNSVEGTRRMLEIAEQADETDLIIFLISGGGSSLMAMPRDGITLKDKKELTDALLKSGATINEINTVRKHISIFKGGWLAKKAYPATILNIILSDVVGDPLDSIASGPTVPDSTTFTDAINVLKKYNLWEKASFYIRKVLNDGENGIIPETPKTDDETFKKVFNIIVGNNMLASQKAREYLISQGLNTLLLTSTLEGEARHVGMVLSSIAHEIANSGNPIPKPAGIVAGGETTVAVTGKGVGGRNQEIALAAAKKLNRMDGAVIASLSTDGVDGSTEAAGAMVDGKTVVKAHKMRLNPEKFLAENDSYNFFSRLGDLILTDPTGTNVNDLSVIIVL
ncbi:MAG: glycerate kinase [Candidatus Bathyarchaeia archaeon]